MRISPTHPDRSRLDAFLAADPVLTLISETAVAEPLFLVGGAIRDSLLGFPVDDIDLVVEGNPEPVIAALDPGARLHRRFGTAELRVGGRRVDLARARKETYRHPGALPLVRFGSIADDLARRDFSLNAIAVTLTGNRRGRLLDPHDGIADLGQGALRVLHANSFRDDPTRAIRGARYAARFGFRPEPETAGLLAAADLDTISGDRLRNELLLLAREERAPEGFRLLGVWGLMKIDPAGPELAARAIELLSGPLWSGAAERDLTVLSACTAPPREAIERLRVPPETPYQGFRLADRFDPVELVLARAAGAAWLDTWRESWRPVALEITGSDLIAAGVDQGPAVGAGIEAALRAKLDRGVSGAQEELQVALSAAREYAGSAEGSETAGPADPEADLRPPGRISDTSADS